MDRTIIPLYDAEKTRLVLTGDRTITIEPWNNQIENLDFHGPVDEPDCVAIIDGALSGRDASAILRDNGFDILPFIFERAYFYNMIADDKGIKEWFATTYFVPKRGNSWIKPEFLGQFLEKAVKSYKNHDLGFALDLHYEIDFRTSAPDVQFVLYMLLLEHLSQKFVDPAIQSPISEAVKTKMLEMAREDMIKNGYMKPKDKPEKYSKYNKLNGDLTSGLSTKSNKEMIFELLREKCKLNVDMKFISDLVSMRGAVVHGGAYSQDRLFEYYPKLEYMCRIALITILTDFDPDYEKYIKVHGFPGFEILDPNKF